jgi:hypothetical protein
MSIYCLHLLPRDVFLLPALSNRSIRQRQEGSYCVHRVYLCHLDSYAGIQSFYFIFTQIPAFSPIALELSL